MLKKINIKFLFSVVLITKVQSAESGGMPQLNPEFWISQIFWLILTFGIMFVVLSKLILPKISNNLETRKSQILENIETAEKQREQSENKIKEYEKLIFESKIEAKNYFSEIRQKVLGDIAKKKQVLDNQIEKELKDVEKEINELKGKAPEKINKIAIETSTDLIKHLIGTEVNSSSISAIVEDISIKNKDKYYGI